MPPFSIEIAEEIAATPFGTSTADAIVVTCIFFLFSCAAVFSFIQTKYAWYDVLIISLLFRTAAFGVRAAYTVKYKPALGGVFLAFSNAGFGANTATVALVIVTWLQAVGERYFGKWTKRFFIFYAIIMVLAVIAFGPICGVIAAGLEYGDYTTRAAKYGERLRVAATYGLVGVVVGTFILLCCLLVPTFITKRHLSRRAPATETTPERRPRLIACLIPVLLFLALRGCTGCVAIYPSHEQYWVKDYLYYSTDSFPEFLDLVILCWPTLLARMGQAYPKPTNPEKAAKAAKGELPPEEMSNGDHTTNGVKSMTHDDHSASANV